MTRLGPGSPDRLGITLDAEGANIAVFSDNATAMTLCLFDAEGLHETARIPLPERSGAVWHGHVAGLGPGQRYGLRADGPFAPDAGHWFNPAKLLLDPYARALHGRFGPSDLVASLVPGSGTAPDRSDSAPAMPKAVMLPDQPRVDPAEHPRTPWAETVIYEAHVKGATRLWPGLSGPVAGTYDALAAPEVIAHLRRLGVTAVELLPVHAFIDDGFLIDRGLVNYWGYNSIAFFVPEPRYTGPAGQGGFRAMVRALHAAGIEVILDVVYNHTGESDATGPTYSFRGLDNAAYYRLMPGRARSYVNDTGTGNTFNLSHPFVLRLVLDSLRYWVEVMGVDGFRFDLATTLAREDHGFDPGSGFLDALRQDPVLAGVKLIAEPWDIGPGGYQLGAFPPGFGEWNDRFRDGVRRFWSAGTRAAQDFAGCLLGSAATFDRAGRRPFASVNYAACHDGMTLADLAAYAGKHNEANGEGNRDGHGENLSENFGVEGPTGDPAIIAARAQRCRNLIASVFLAQGTPMLRAGDEVLGSQQGNNNAYPQDNAISWIDWAGGDAGFATFVARLAAFRRDHPVLRQSRFLHGRPRPLDRVPDVAWFDLTGGPIDWRDPALCALAVLVRGAAGAPGYVADPDAVLIACNAGAEAARMTLPPPPAGRMWWRALDTAAPEGRDWVAEAVEPIPSESIVVFAARAAAVAGGAR